MAKSVAADLMIKLSTDPALRSRFQTNPGAVLDEMGIHGEDREILLSGDPARLRGYLDGNDAPPGCIVMFTTDDKA